MKAVFTLLLAGAAAAQAQFNDEDLTLIQLRSAKHHSGGAQEEANQAQADADGALALANNALNTAFQSEDDAQAAQDDAAAGANPNAGQADEAQAVGDPHLTLSNGKKADLCCHGGKCKPCKPALLQTKQNPAQDEAAQAQNEADEAAQMANEAMEEAQDAQVEAQQAQQDAVAEAAGANAGQQDQAEAVGDPHMKLSNGQKADLCCEGHVCKKCPKSLLQTSDALADAQAAEDAAVEAQAVAQQAVDEAQEAQQAAQAATAAANGQQQDVAVPVAQQQDEAAAVGDPHLTLNTGAKKELCCKGKHCKPC